MLKSFVLVCTLGCLWPQVDRAQEATNSPSPASAPGAAAPNCTPPASSQLTVPLRAQEASNWCWAASAQMIVEYLGHSGTDSTQCSQANRKNFTHKNCCSKPIPAECDQPEWPDFSYFTDRGGRTITYKMTQNAPLSEEKVKSLLAPRDPKNPCSFTPFAFTWHYTGTGGHMMVATGYRIVDGELVIEVNNPLAVNKGSTQELLYEQYVSSSTYTHWNDYYDFQ